jgi:hypothetical protein
MSKQFKGIVEIEDRELGFARSSASSRLPLASERSRSPGDSR